MKKAAPDRWQWRGGRGSDYAKPPVAAVTIASSFTGSLAGPRSSIRTKLQRFPEWNRSRSLDAFRYVPAGRAQSLARARAQLGQFAVQKSALSRPHPVKNESVQRPSVANLLLVCRPRRCSTAAAERRLLPRASRQRKSIAAQENSVAVVETCRMPSLISSIFRREPANLGSRRRAAGDRYPEDWPGPLRGRDVDLQRRGVCPRSPEGASRTSASAGSRLRLRKKGRHAQHHRARRGTD